MLSKTCNYRPHPNSRSQCGVHLLRSVNLLSGKQLLYPFKVFCYQGLRVSIRNFLLRPGFVELCEHWRSLPNSTELRDIYDGKIWKEFQHLNGQPALADSYVYAVMLNIDWFQPFKLTNASVGAMYLTVLNLPLQDGRTISCHQDHLRKRFTASHAVAWSYHREFRTSVIQSSIQLPIQKRECHSSWGYSRSH